MKALLVLVIFCSISFICFGQQKIIDPNIKADTVFFNNVKHFQIKQADEILASKIIVLPIDNMPCLVANKKIIAPIPNAIIKNDVINDIPNPLKDKEPF
jgi:hypothetical protein